MVKAVEQYRIYSPLYGGQTCRETNEALLASEERFRLIFEYAPIGMLIADFTGRLERVNPAMCDLIGYSAIELLNMRLQDIIDPDDWDDRCLSRELAHGKKTRVVLEKRFVRQDGQFVFIRLYIALLRDHQGNSLHFIGQMIDITEQKKQERSMQHMAYHDLLTGLGNRLHFQDCINAALARAKAADNKIGVIYLDLDRFKQINDSAGHNAGDQALKIIADRITSCVRKTDAVARMGGDEFTILLTSVAGGQALQKIADKILQAIEQPIQIDGRQFHVSASIGTAVYPADGASADQLLGVADQAMYTDKHSKGIES